MNQDLLLILIITIAACVLTIIMVAIVSFSISTKLALPLTKLMEFSALVNANVANKTLANKYFYGMDKVTLWKIQVIF